MAELCNLSENQFRRVFNQHTGMSPKRYVDKLRMQQACEILSSTVSPIAEVAHQFGYSDPYHFSRRFKDIIGLSPENYRNSYSLHQ